MMNQPPYSAEDLATDQSFQAWVRGSDPRACEYWENWICWHAESKAVVEEAKNMVRQLQFRDYPFQAEMEEVRDNLHRARQFTRTANRQAKLLRLYRQAAVAAAVILVTGAWWLFQKPVSRSGTPAPAARSLAEEVRPAPQILTWRTQTNTGRKTARVLLEDHSVVTLFPNASIRYPAPFAGDQREIRLTGDAIFEVAKDRRKPFTVYSLLLSVTALGTSFRVTVPDQRAASVTVKLFTGKVRILPTGSPDSWKEDEAVFLLPGQQLQFDGSRKTVSRFRPPPVVPNGTNFSNTPLPIVMKALSTLYKIKIDYNPSDIATINFTGAIDKGDELKAVLQAIAQMNGLRVIQTKDGFSVIRPGK